MSKKCNFCKKEEVFQFMVCPNCASSFYLCYECVNFKLKFPSFIVGQKLQQDLSFKTIGINIECIVCARDKKIENLLK